MKRGWGGRGWGVPLPKPPFNTMSAQTSPTGRGVGEVQEDKEKLNTMKLQLHKQLHRQDLLPKLHIHNDMSCVCEQWPCGFPLLGVGCIFSQGVLAGVFDREGVKLLSSHCPQGRTTQGGWRRHLSGATCCWQTHTYNPVTRTHTHTYHTTRSACSY